MKKLVLVLVAMFGLYLGANAQVLSCDVYNADDLTAKLSEKGAQSTDSGCMNISVEIIQKSDSEYVLTYATVTVSVEVIDQNTRKVVRREDINVSINNGRGYKSENVCNYEPNHDYIFSINKDRTCM